jgi:hypothetical protein
MHQPQGKREPPLQSCDLRVNKTPGLSIVCLSSSFPTNQLYTKRQSHFSTIYVLNKLKNKLIRSPQETSNRGH